MIDSTDLDGLPTANVQLPNGSITSPSPPGGVPKTRSYPGVGPQIARPITTGSGGQGVVANPVVSVGWRVPEELGAGLARALRNRLRSYRKQLRQCQEDFSESSVHRLRVATRRLIAQFALLSSVAPSAKTGKARKILKRRLKLLGELRDVHVQMSIIARQWPRYPELVLVLDFISRQERRLTKALARKVQEHKLRKLEKCGAALCAELRISSDDTVRREAIASKVFGAMAEAFAEVARRRQAIDPNHSATVHRTRVAFKKFRYIVESLSPAFTGLRGHHLRRFGTYQRRMGHLQDLEMFQAFIARFVKERPGTESLLRPFIRYLKERRARALRRAVRHADDLFVFWRLAGLDQTCEGTLSRNAA